MDSENRILYSAFHWSTEVIIITSVCLLMITGCVIWVYKMDVCFLIKYLLLLPFILIIILFCSQSPRYLTVSKGNIRIKKIIGAEKISIKDILSVAHANRGQLKGSVRVGASGGLFGYVGHFKNEYIGRYLMFATKKENLVLIFTTKKTYVVNVEEPSHFIDIIIEIQNQLRNNNERNF